jgi:mRNA interferase RelE/StbE
MRITFRPAAHRDLRRLTPEMADRVEADIDALAEDPRPPGALVLREWAFRAWRIRVGDWRVIYTIDDAAALVTVVRILHRSKAY